MTIRLKKRHRLRRKEIKSLTTGLESIFSLQCFSSEDTLDMANIGQFDAILVNGEILGLVIDERPFLTVKGLLKFHPEKRFVTVDMGAVKFVYNGADVMAPGIVDADLNIKTRDLVWVRDEKNLKPLAIGEALMDAREMIDVSHGKAVKSIHYVGDEIWDYET
jgi:PUA domain protein